MQSDQRSTPAGRWRAIAGVHRKLGYPAVTGTTLVRGKLQLCLGEDGPWCPLSTPVIAAPTCSEASGNGSVDRTNHQRPRCLEKRRPPLHLFGLSVQRKDSSTNFVRLRDSSTRGRDVLIGEVETRQKAEELFVCSRGFHGFEGLQLAGKGSCNQLAVEFAKLGYSNLFITK